MTSMVVGVGYIGLQLVQDLLASGEKVVGIENFFSTRARPVLAMARRLNFPVAQGSILKPEVLEHAFARAGQVDTLYLLAAQASAHPAIHPAFAEETNLQGARLVAEAARAHRVRTVVYASSLRVVGVPLPPVVEERLEYGPISDLAHLTKVYGEKLLEMYAFQGAFQVASVRLGICHGVGPVMKTDPRFMTAPNRFCLQLCLGEPLCLNPDARYAQGFIHVADASRALIMAASPPEAGGGEAFRVLNAATEVMTINSLASMAVEAARSLGLLVPTLNSSLANSAHPIIRSSLPMSYPGSFKSLAPSLVEIIRFFRRRIKARQRRQA